MVRQGKLQLLEKPGARRESPDEVDSLKAEILRRGSVRE